MKILKIKNETMKHSINRNINVLRKIGFVPLIYGVVTGVYLLSGQYFYIFVSGVDYLSQKERINSAIVSGSFCILATISTMLALYKISGLWEKTKKIENEENNVISLPLKSIVVLSSYIVCAMFVYYGFSILKIPYYGAIDIFILSFIIIISQKNTLFSLVFLEKNRGKTH